MKLSFKRTINWNKYQSKVTIQDNAGRTGYTGYFLLAVEIKDYNVIIDWENFFDQPVKSGLRTYDNIRKNATGQREDYATDWLLDYPYFNKHDKMIVIDLNKRQVLHADAKVKQQINFTRSLDQDGNTTVLFIIEEANGTILHFLQGTVRIL